MEENKCLAEDRGCGVGGDFDSLIHFDMRLLDPVPRSLRLNGKATCLRLERIYWSILEYAAHRRNEQVSALLSNLDREVQLRFGRVTNFSSMVRVLSVVQIAKACPDLLEWLTHRDEHE